MKSHMICSTEICYPLQGTRRLTWKRQSVSAEATRDKVCEPAGKGKFCGPRDGGYFPPLVHPRAAREGASFHLHDLLTNRAGGSLREEIDRREALLANNSMPIRCTIFVRALPFEVEPLPHNPPHGRCIRPRQHHQRILVLQVGEFQIPGGGGAAAEARQEVHVAVALHAVVTERLRDGLRVGEVLAVVEEALVLDRDPLQRLHFVLELPHAAGGQRKIDHHGIPPQGLHEEDVLP